MAVDGGHVYWVNHGGSIARADLNGQNATGSFIIGASSPNAVAVDGGHVYWTNGTDTIGRADLNGQNPNQSFITVTGDSFPTGVAVDGGHVYWANFNTDTIGRADLNGQNVEQSFITGASFPWGVAVDGGHRLLGEPRHRQDRPRRPERAEREPELHHHRFLAPRVAVDGGHVYWTNQEANTIGRADLNGQNPNQSFITGAFAPLGWRLVRARAFPDSTFERRRAKGSPPLHLPRQAVNAGPSCLADSM